MLKAVRNSSARSSGTTPVAMSKPMAPEQIRSPPALTEKLGMALLAALGLGCGGGAQEEVTPAHVYRSVGQVAANVELIREVKGRLELTTAHWVVVDAQPRHVYFQTLTLFRKANRLAVELAGAERMAPPPVLEAEIAPADVYDPATTLLSELAHLTLVLDAKDVPAPAVERPKHVFPAHVFRMAGMLQDELARLEAQL